MGIREISSDLNFSEILSVIFVFINPGDTQLTVIFFFAYSMARLFDKATAGNNKLGGDDFDDKVIDWLVKEFKKDTGIDLSKDVQAMSRLK